MLCCGSTYPVENESRPKKSTSERDMMDGSVFSSGPGTARLGKSSTMSEYWTVSPEAAIQRYQLAVEAGRSAFEQRLIAALLVSTAAVTLVWGTEAKRWYQFHRSSLEILQDSKKENFVTSIAEEFEFAKSELNWVFGLCVLVSLLEFFQVRAALDHGAQRIAVLTRSSVRHAICFGVLLRLYCLLFSLPRIEARLGHISSLLMAETSHESFATKLSKGKIPFPPGIFRPTGSAALSALSLSGALTKLAAAAPPRLEYGLVALFSAFFRFGLYLPALNLWARRLLAEHRYILEDTQKGRLQALLLVPTSTIQPDAVTLVLMRALRNDIWCMSVNVVCGLITAITAFKWNESISIDSSLITLRATISGLCIAWILLGCLPRIAELGHLSSLYERKLKNDTDDPKKKKYSDLDIPATDGLVKVANRLHALLNNLHNRWENAPPALRQAVFVLAFLVPVI